MTFLRNIFFTVVSNLGMTLLGLLTGVLLARTLGPTGRGLMTTVMIWPAILVWAGGLSFGYANIHFAASEPGTRQKLFANSFWIAIGLGLAIGLPSALVLPHFVKLNQSQHLLLVISLILLPLGMWSDFAASLLQGTGRFDRLGMIRIAAPLLTAIALFFLWGIHTLTVTTAVIASWIGGWTQIALTMNFLWREGYVAFRPDGALLKRSWTYSSRIHIGTLANLANGRIDQLIMTLLVAPKALGLYVFAVTFSELLRQGTASIAVVVFPRVSAETVQLEKQAMASQAVRWTLLAACICAVILAIAAPTFVALVWGKRFVDAIPTIYVLLPGTVALGAASTMTVSLNGAGRPGTGTVAELASLVVMLPLLWLLLPHLGILGAGVASTCGYCVNCIVSSFYFAQTFGKDGLRGIRPTRQDWVQICSVAGRVRGRLQPVGGRP